MLSFLELIEHFFECDHFITTHEDIYANHFAIKGLQFNIRDINGADIALEDAHKYLRARIIFENESLGNITVSSKIFTHCKKIMAIDYQQPIDSADDNEYRELIDKFLIAISCEQILYEFYARDMSDFSYGFSDNKLFAISKHDTEILNIVEYNDSTATIIFRDYGFGYNNTLGLILQNYVEFCGQKLIYEFEFDENSKPLFSTKTYLSGRIIDTDYNKYGHKYFLELFAQK